MFSILGKITGKRRMVHLPGGIMTAIAGAMEIISKYTGLPPVIPKDWVKKYLSNWIMGSNKAIDELGYRITPFEDGARKTLIWLETLQAGG